MQDTVNNGIGAVAGIVYLAIMIITLAGMAKTFMKANQSGWAVIIPIYNIYVMTRVAQVSGWVVVAFFVPLINVVAAIYLKVRIASAFGRGPGFGIGLLFLPFIFYPILGFGDAQFRQLPVKAG